MLECCLPDDGHEKLLKYVVGDNELNAHCSGDVFFVVTIDSHCLTQQNQNYIHEIVIHLLQFYLLHMDRNNSQSIGRIYTKDI
jgi:hypothetical protein